MLGLTRRSSLLLIGILILAAFLRFFYIGIYPEYTDATSLPYRFITSVVSIITSYVIFYYMYLTSKSSKQGLIASFIFSVSPIVIEQSRIVSFSQWLSPILLLGILLIEQRNTVIKSALYIFFISTGIYLLPKILIGGIQLIPVTELLNRIFLHLSFESFFFSSEIFWAGSLRVFGILYITLLPFFLIGLYKTVKQKKWIELGSIGFCVLISSISVMYPNARIVYVVLPLITIITARGVTNSLTLISNRLLINIVIIATVLLLTYELTQVVHYYFIHYPQQIRDSVQNIHELF